MKIHRCLAASAAALAVLASVATNASAQNWTGLYLGASAGYASAKSNWSPTGFTSFDTTGKGGIGGIQGGYNLQSGSILAGLEADYMFSSLKGDTACPGGGFTCSMNVKGLGSVRGRLGWVATPSAMIYFTAGLGWAPQSWDVKNTATGSLVGGGTYASTTTGLAFGAGAEFMLTRNWTLKGEYLRYDFSRSSAGAASFSGTPIDFKTTADTFKLGVNYKF